MTVQPEVLLFLHQSGFEYEALDCDPDLADTAEFCLNYGYPPETAVNTILVASKRPPGEFIACLVLATTRLDVNGRVRELTGWRKASFAKPEDTSRLTGMAIGGVTPFALPEDMSVLIDSAVMAQPWVIVGAGSRSAKLKVEPATLSRLPAAQVVDGLAHPVVQASSIDPTVPY